MATPSSLSYHEQSYPEGVHILRSQIQPARGIYLLKAWLLLSLKRVWNGVLHLVCWAAMPCVWNWKQANQQQLSLTPCSDADADRSDQLSSCAMLELMLRRLDTRHRTHDYFAFQWSLIDFCASETGVVNSELAA